MITATPVEHTHRTGRRRATTERNSDREVRAPTQPRRGLLILLIVMRAARARADDAGGGEPLEARHRDRSSDTSAAA
jgi:hypothetical protein